MSSITRREVVVTTVEFRVPVLPPWGATYTDVLSAINQAIAEYNQRYRLGQGRPSSDSIRVHVEDEAVVVSYMKTDEETT